MHINLVVLPSLSMLEIAETDWPFVNLKLPKSEIGWSNWLNQRSCISQLNGFTMVGYNLSGAPRPHPGTFALQVEPFKS